MGIGGHILGEKKLRKLNRVTGMNFDRAYRRGSIGEGREIIDGQCKHYHLRYGINSTVSVYGPVSVMHWTSCPKPIEE